MVDAFGCLCIEHRKQQKNRAEIDVSVHM